MQVKCCDFCFAPIEKNDEYGRVIFKTYMWDVCKTCFEDISRLKEIMNRRMADKK